MIFFPAIDLKDGQCVRLLRGEMDQATVFGDDPAAQAKAFQDQGCQWIHVVDLNGAFQGRPVNRTAVEGILAAIDLPVQLGGGIRDMATIETWLGAGVARVILGQQYPSTAGIMNELRRMQAARLRQGCQYVISAPSPSIRRLPGKHNREATSLIEFALHRNRTTVHLDHALHQR